LNISFPPCRIWINIYSPQILVKRLLWPYFEPHFLSLSKCGDLALQFRKKSPLHKNSVSRSFKVECSSLLCQSKAIAAIGGGITDGRNKDTLLRVVLQTLILQQKCQHWRKRNPSDSSFLGYQDASEVAEGNGLARGPCLATAECTRCMVMNFNTNNTRVRVLLIQIPLQK